MGQNLTVPAEFNQSRQVFSFPSWYLPLYNYNNRFITNHDVTPADVRNARSFISSYYLDQTATYELIKYRVRKFYLYLEGILRKTKESSFYTFIIELELIVPNLLG